VFGVAIRGNVLRTCLDPGPRWPVGKSLSVPVLAVLVRCKRCGVHRADGTSYPQGLEFTAPLVAGALVRSGSRPFHQGQTGTIGITKEMAAQRAHLAHVAPRRSPDGRSYQLNYLSLRAATPARSPNGITGLRLGGRSRSKIAQQPLQRLLVALVVFPPPEISNVPAAPYVRRPGLRRAHYRVVDADREEHETILALLTLARCIDLALHPAALDRSLRHHDHYLVIEANGFLDALLESIPNLEIFRRDQTRRCWACRSACRRSAKPWSLLE
jgi:hypothetical protein